MQRRDFVQTAGLAALGALALPACQATKAVAGPSPRQLPRWRGFNLLEKFIAEVEDWNKPYREQDFAWMAEWGFDFARLPMSYRCWMTTEQWFGQVGPQPPNEAKMKEIDQAVAWGKAYKIHVNLNLHRIQGYCVNPPAEPVSLWTDERALAAAVWQWQYLARRYRGIPNTELSFDLINEPANVDETSYVRVIKAIVEGIRQVDPQRLIVADGLHYGTQPVFGLKDLNLGQSTRGYNPMQVSHYQANWVVGSQNWPAPTWPLANPDGPWDKEKLRRDFIAPWQKLAREGVGVHVGEWGCYRFTPHATALRWMEDCLSLWQEAGWGWSLWNLRGDFGILSSQRADVAYENFKGEKLDRPMLELLKRY
jgi:endoglucanase